MTFYYKSVDLTSLHETLKSILKGIYSDRVRSSKYAGV